jgi:hypothetical protein
VAVAGDDRLLIRIRLLGSEKPARVLAFAAGTDVALQYAIPDLRSSK